MDLISVFGPLLVLAAISLAGRVAYVVGRSMVTDALGSRGSLPAWLEAGAPLKGRWLRLCLAAPWIVTMSAATFVVVFLLLLAALFGIGMGLAATYGAVMGSLG